MECLWKLENVSKKYDVKKGDEVLALNSVSFEILKGETFGVIGESGSGKTTLGKVMIGLIEPTEGKIYFRDTSLTDLRGKKLLNLRKEFQIVFQDPYRSLNPKMRVKDTVMEGIRDNTGMKEKREKVKELLGMVGIEPARMYDYPHQFSGGERQRIAIARALSTSPSFIVCDEPTSNLDLSVQAKILNLFLELKERLNLTYLFISHNIKVVDFIADRVAVMYKGRIVEYGEKVDIIKNPLHPYTSVLILSAFLRKADINEKEKSAGKGCAFYPLCIYAKTLCSEHIPQLKEIDKGHFVACFKRT
ncbi:MAG: ABC transporter ATP-binding protein [Candidatus Omnitrophica bacterium]|nr:ABC transporter ATP-binding protein [Candidatus Omnitrophota bacterium]MCM8777368.1 ABC transporter ATP-binding protein [Candidatus Omnitrophota bacterium]